MSNAFKLKNGSILLSTEAPGGIYNASQLKAIANLCDTDSVMVKATEDQRLALLVAPEKAGMIADSLMSIGLGIRHYQDGLHQPVSCIGEMCAEFEQDALGSAMDISSEIDGIKLNSPLKIGLNGCAKCCVPCHTLDVSIIGDSQGYRISLGGKNSQLPEMASFMAESVPADELPKLIKNIIEIYQQDAQEGETLQELIDRNGAGKFINALAPWSQDAAGPAEPSFAQEEGEASENNSNALSNDLNLINESENIELSSDSEIIDDEPVLTSIDSDNSLDHELLSAEESNISINAIDGESTSAINDVTTEDVDSSIEPTSLELNQTDNTLEAEPELAIVDSDNSIDQQLISREESSTTMNSALDEASEVENLDFNLTANQMSSNENSLGEISVTSDTDVTPMNVPIQVAADEIPEINMQELEIEEQETNIETAETPNNSSLEHLETVELAEIDQEDIFEPEQITFDTSSFSQGIEPDSLPTDKLTVETETAIANDLEPTNVDLNNEEEAEAKLTAGIHAQQEIIALDQDEQEFERDASAKLLETSTESLEESNISPQLSDPIDTADPQSSETYSPNNFENGIDTSSYEVFEDDEEDDDEFDVNEHLPLSEVVATRKIIPSKTQKQVTAWTISGFDIDESGLPVISWSNGVKITITPDAIEHGQISIGGHELAILQKENGIQVEVDGLKLYLPLAA